MRVCSSWCVICLGACAWVSERGGCGAEERVLEPRLGKTCEAYAWARLSMRGKCGLYMSGCSSCGRANILACVRAGGGRQSAKAESWVKHSRWLADTECAHRGGVLQ